MPQNTIQMDLGVNQNRRLVAMKHFRRRASLRNGPHKKIKLPIVTP